MIHYRMLSIFIMYLLQSKLPPLIICAIILTLVAFCSFFNITFFFALHHLFHCLFLWLFEWNKTKVWSVSICTLTWRYRWHFPFLDKHLNTQLKMFELFELFCLPVFASFPIHILYKIQTIHFS